MTVLNESQFREFMAVLRRIAMVLTWILFILAGIWGALIAGL